MAESWVRLWAGMTTDPKWQTIARKSGQPRALVIALFAHLLMVANEGEERGDLSRLDVEDTASALDVGEEAVSAILAAMEGRVIEGGRLSGWDRRQPEREDLGNPGTGAMSAAERKRRQREREALSRHVTACHEQSRDVTACHAPEAEADTEADIPPTPPTAREARDGEFPMDLTWEPSDHFPTLARQAGAPMPTQEALAEFRSYWLGQGAAMSQHQWDHKLLTNLKAQRVKSAQGPPSRASPKSARDESRQWGRELVTTAKQREEGDGRTIDA